MIANQVRRAATRPTVATDTNLITAPFTGNFSSPMGFTCSASQDLETVNAPWTAFNLDPATGNGWLVYNGLPAWIEIDLLADHAINRVDITHQTGDRNRQPKDYTITGWNGSSWDTLTTVIGYVVPWPGETHTINFPEGICSKLRFNVTAIHQLSESYLLIRELGIYGTIV